MLITKGLVALLQNKTFVHMDVDVEGTGKYLPCVLFCGKAIESDARHGSYSQVLTDFD